MESPQESPNIDANLLKKKKGLIMVFTGEGKGKTTAALGTAFRAVGTGMKVSMIQFIKGKWTSGEHTAVSRLAPDFEIIRMGEGFTWETKNRDRDIASVRRTWDVCREKLKSGRYQLIIFDEINYAIDYDYLDIDDVIETLRLKPPMTHVILTGRNAKRELIDMADLVSDIHEVKHPFSDQKIPAQRGIDF